MMMMKVMQMFENSVQFEEYFLKSTISVETEKKKVFC